MTLITVYKISEKYEIDVDDKDEYKAKLHAISRVKSGDIRHTKKDCNYIAFTEDELNS